MNYYLIFIALILIFLSLRRERKRKIATIVNHRKNHKNKENTKMKELALKFIGKECLIYTVTRDGVSVKGTVTEITDGGMLIDCEGRLEAVNLEYVERIEEWPRNAKGKKKNIIA